MIYRSLILSLLVVWPISLTEAQTDRTSAIRSIESIIQLRSQGSQQRFERTDGPPAPSSQVREEALHPHRQAVEAGFEIASTIPLEFSDWSGTVGWEVTNASAEIIVGPGDREAGGGVVSGQFPVPVGQKVCLVYDESMEGDAVGMTTFASVSTDRGLSWIVLDERTGGIGRSKWSIDLTTYRGKSVMVGFQYLGAAGVTPFHWWIGGLELQVLAASDLSVTLPSINTQKFPYVYLNVGIDSAGIPMSEVPAGNIRVIENGQQQLDYFEVTPPESSNSVRLADIVFVLDVTGSMSSRIAAVKANMLNFMTNLAGSGINYGIGIVVFGDVTYTYNNGNLYYDQGTILSLINAITLGEHGIGSGGDGPENQLEALYQGSRMNFRPGAHRVEILLTDIYAHQADAVTPWTVTTLIPQLVAADVTVYPIFPTTNTTARAQYIPIAQATNPDGAYYDISTNFNAIIQDIGNSIAATYIVKYKSSDPVINGIVRDVAVIAEHGGMVDTAFGSYTPGAAPIISRTAATLALHDQSWSEGSSLVIEALVVDHVPPIPSGLTLYFRRTNAASYSSLAMTNLGSNLYSGVIPTGVVLTPGIDYYLSASDGIAATTDPGTDPTQRPYQIGILPNVPPSIVHSPPVAFTPGVDLTLGATISDETNLLASAILYYRVAGQLTYQSIVMTHGGGGAHTAIIPASFVTDLGIEYYLEARDDFGVTSTRGTRDVPLFLGNPLAYVDQKRAIIEFFQGEGRYDTEEAAAAAFVDQIESRINAGTLGSQDLESIRRLGLMEEALKYAYQSSDDEGARRLAELSSHCATHAAVAWTFEFGFARLRKLLEPVKNTPILKGVYKGVDKTAKRFSEYAIKFVRSTVTNIGNRLTPVLMTKYGISREAAQQAAMKIAWDLVPSAAVTKQVAEDGFSEVVAGSLDEILVEPFLDLYEDGIGIPVAGAPGGAFVIGGTGRTAISAVESAEDHRLTSQDIEVLSSEIRTTNIPAMIEGNRRARGAVDAFVTLAEWIKIAELLVLGVALVAAIAGVIVGLVSCPASGGLGCILSTVSGLSIWGIVAAILPYFGPAEATSYTAGAGVGLYHLQLSLPEQVRGVDEALFAQVPLNNQGQAVPVANSPVVRQNFPTGWADSISSRVAEITGQLDAIHASITAGAWDSAEVQTGRLSDGLDSLARVKEQLFSLIDAAYASNGSLFTDSMYHEMSAYSGSGDMDAALIMLGLSTGIAQAVEGPHRDTVLSLIDSVKLHMLQYDGYARTAITTYSALGIQVPAVFSLTEVDIDQVNDSIVVTIGVRNLSGMVVDGIDLELARLDSDHVQMIDPPLATISLPPDGEVTHTWVASYQGSGNYVSFRLSMQPHPGGVDFLPSIRIISDYFEEPTITQSVQISPRWNLLSLPVRLDEPVKSVVYPAAITDAFVFDGAYHARDTLRIGEGYWIKFPNTAVFPIEGYEIDDDTIDVVAGWNMIGSISTPVSVHDLISIPGGLTSSEVFGYSAGYYVTDSIRPGYGYWIKVEQPGMIILQPGSGAEMNTGRSLRMVRGTALPPGPPDGGILDGEPVPAEYGLYQAYPNPFNPITTIRYEIPWASTVKLRVYNALGQLLEVLADRVVPAGYHSVEWDGDKHPSGVYFYRFEAASIDDPSLNYFKVQKMVLLK